MRYERVHLEAFGHALPDEVVTSEELERRMAPLYDRFGLSVGRLELMSGIRERRFWPPGTKPSTVAARAGAQAIERSGIDRSRIGMLIHSSVSRDFLEPATASVVHHLLDLPPHCQPWDLSNACLGMANAMAVVASRLELGEIEAGLVVAGEDGRPLVEETVRFLNESQTVGRRELKAAYASLTIGAGAVAVVMTRDDVAQNPRRLLGSTALADTQHHVLCAGDHSGSGSGILMETDSEALLHAGNALAARTFQAFLDEMGWRKEEVDRYVTHQVGVATADSCSRPSESTSRSTTRPSKRSGTWARSPCRSPITWRNRTASSSPGTGWP